MAQIVLYNVSNDEKYFPQRRDLFNDARWNEAKRLMAQTLKQHSKEAGRYSLRFLQDRMVAEDLKDTMAQAAVWYKTNIIELIKY